MEVESIAESTIINAIGLADNDSSIVHLDSPMLQRCNCYHRAIRIMISIFSLKPCLSNGSIWMVHPHCYYSGAIVIPIVRQLEGLGLDVVYRPIGLRKLDAHGWWFIARIIAPNYCALAVAVPGLRLEPLNTELVKYLSGV